jgi:hypothetical protein
VYAEALTLHGQVRSPDSEVEIATVLCRLADITLEQGEWPMAQRYTIESLALVRELGVAAEPHVAVALALLADLAAVQNEPHRALRLAGAAAALQERAGSQLPAWLQDRLSVRTSTDLHERRLAQARATLSAEEQAAAWAEGQALTPEEAIAEALGAAHAPG